MAELANSTTALTKDYGSGRGIFDLDLDIPAGEVFGFIGPNGAGKTTTIRLLMDLVRPTRGRARPARPGAATAEVGPLRPTPRPRPAARTTMT